jgi:hypothetical protein
MIDAMETRVLSSGEVLVFPTSLDRLIVVDRARAHLVGPGPDAWKTAEALVSAGQAKRFEGSEVEQITAAFRSVGLLMPSTPFLDA